MPPRRPIRSNSISLTPASTPLTLRRSSRYPETPAYFEPGPVKAKDTQSLQKLELSYTRPNTVQSGTFSNEEIRKALKIPAESFKEFHELLYFVFRYHLTLNELSLQPGPGDARQDFCDVTNLYMAYLSIQCQTDFQPQYFDGPEMAWLLYQVARNVRQEVRAARQQKQDSKAVVPQLILEALMDGTFPRSENFDLEAIAIASEDDNPISQSGQSTPGLASPIRRRDEMVEPEDPMDLAVEENTGGVADRVAPDALVAQQMHNQQHPVPEQVSFPWDLIVLILVYALFIS
ncbi:hypothetical protein TWF696_008618 [Orbilia brochopaga]|uniref:Uncharacterized protein n=1 Tax=Orbilia brochopaga TaxID=3140254 RepID=A0AAV9UKB4_9PEZI